MRQLLLLAMCAALAMARLPPTDLDGMSAYTFKQYTADFNKRYSAEEYAERAKHFEEAKATILAHNKDPAHSWRMGFTNLADASPAEFKRMRGGRPSAASKVPGGTNLPYKNSGNPVPRSVDWRERVPSVLTPVKDQGFCGSCWAHASTESIETHWAIQTGQLFTLSQQQVTACAPNPDDCGGFGGCDGSIAELAFDYVARNGIAQEWVYPYSAYYGTTGACNVSSVKTAVSVKASVKLAANSQADVMDALATVGPLAINVAALPWKHYTGGVFSGCSYNLTVDHVVQLVGYGHDSSLNLDYWIVRNSWSPAWGESGYIRLLRQTTPTCGWDVNPQDGTGCNGGPAQLNACGQCGLLLDTSYPLMDF